MHKSDSIQIWLFRLLLFLNYCVMGILFKFWSAFSFRFWTCSLRMSCNTMLMASSFTWRTSTQFVERKVLDCLRTAKCSMWWLVLFADTNSCKSSLIRSRYPQIWCFQTKSSVQDSYSHLHMSPMRNATSRISISYQARLGPNSLGVKSVVFECFDDILNLLQ